jgi:hypothetical protein
MKKILLTFSISLIIVSCQEKGNFLTDYFDKIQEYELKEVTEYPHDSIGHPDMIFSHEDYIILSEPKLEHLLSSYDMKTQSFIRFLPKGDGPDALLDIQQVGMYKNYSLFCVKSTFSKNIFIYAFNSTSILMKDEVPDKDILSFFYDNDKLICSQTGKQKRCSLYGKSTVGFGEDILIKDVSPDIVTSILTGKCAGNIKSKRVTWACYYGDIFEIYDYGNPDNIKTIISVKGILPVIPHPDSPIFSIESKIGISSIAVTDKHIYLLYNENQIKDFSEKKHDILLSDKILVYDWNGVAQKILKTNKLIKSMSYNSKSERIYCIGYDGDDGKIYYIDDLE